MRKEIKETMVLNWIINLSVWVFLYFCKTVYLWEFTNPFQWIIDIPTYKGDDRLILILLLLFWQVFQSGVIYIYKTDKLNEKDKR